MAAIVECPKCGAEVATPIKVCSIRSGGLRESGEPKPYWIFECPKCKARFKAFREAEHGSEETASIKNMVERIKCIKGELMQTLKNLHERIKTLETERTNLMIEIDKLRKVAESRANALESEVAMLREEVKTLRDLLGYSKELEE